MALGMASAKSASSRIMLGDLPPNSSVTRFMVRLPRGPQVDFTGLEDRVENYLTQAMHADLDHTMLRGTGAPTSFAATAAQARTPRARDDLFDSIRYSFASSEAITEGRVAMWMSLAEAASRVGAPQDASDDLCITQGRRRIRIRRE